MKEAQINIDGEAYGVDIDTTVPDHMVAVVADATELEKHHVRMLPIGIIAELYSEIMQYVSEIGK